MMPEHVRVAFGTGVVIGLCKGQLLTLPTTAHLLTYYEKRCNANCKFCPQASGSTADLKMLSRVTWPRFELKKVLERLKKNPKFQRLCIQAINYPNVVSDICKIVAQVKAICSLPISVSCQPLGPNNMKKLAEMGVERVSIPLDAATPELFQKIKSNGYTWNTHLNAIDNARTIFPGRVSTHLIVGLGETEEEMARTIQVLHDRGITIGLFAFTPIPGTPLSNYLQPDVSSYRRIQLARFLISNNLASIERMHFGSGKITDFGVERDVVYKTVESGEPFRTSGCPGCNRPFYNESPRGPIYNYPRKPTKNEITIIKRQLS